MHDGEHARTAALEADPDREPRSCQQRDVLVVEARHVGFGASGRNGGGFSSKGAGIADLLADPATRPGAVRLQRLMIETVAEGGEFLAREGIDCDWVRSGTVDAATSPAQEALAKAYLAALEDSKRIARDGIDGAMDEHGLDALIAPTNGPAWMIDHVNGDSFHIGSSSLAAVSGYPNVTVPAGFVSGLPIGVSFMGKPWNEKQLIEIAYAFEQATGARRAPEL